jgi:hypothetical protein
MHRGPGNRALLSKTVPMRAGKGYLDVPSGEKVGGHRFSAEPAPTRFAASIP